nr:hypothetical protein CFP56_24506 [Quercus suber]
MQSQVVKVIEAVVPAYRCYYQREDNADPEQHADRSDRPWAVLPMIRSCILSRLTLEELQAYDSATLYEPCTEQSGSCVTGAQDGIALRNAERASRTEHRMSHGCPRSTTVSGDIVASASRRNRDSGHGDHSGRRQRGHLLSTTALTQSALHTIDMIEAQCLPQIPVGGPVQDIFEWFGVDPVLLRPNPDDVWHF